MHQILRLLGYLALTLVGVLGLVLLVVLGAWAAANTEPGREWLSARLAEALSTPESRAEVEGLRGPFPQRAALQRVVMHDSEGPWLTLETAELSWRPRALLSGRIEIDVVRAERLAVHRPPPPEPVERPREEDPRLTLPRPPLPVQLDRFHIERLELDEPVLGQAAVLRVEGGVVAPAEGAFRARLQVERLDAPGTTFVADARYLPEDQHLALDARLDDAADGLLTALLDLPTDDAVWAELKGEGPLDAWRGRLRGDFGPDVNFALDLTLEGAETLEVSGRTELRGLLGPEEAALVGGPVDLDLRARRGDSDVFRLERGKVSAPTADIRVSGLYDSGRGTLEATGEVSFSDPGPVNALTAPAEVAGVAAEFALEGPILAPRLRLDARAERVSAPEGIVHGLRLRGDYAPANGPTRGELTLEAESERVELSDPALAPFSGEPLSASLSGEVDLEAERIEGAALRLESPLAVVRAQGRGDFGARRGEVDFEVTLPDLGRLAALAELEMAGRGAVEGNLTYAGPGAGGAARVQARFSELRWADPDLAPLLGEEMSLASEIELGADGVLTLRDLTAEAATASARGSVDIPADFATIAAEIDLRVPELARLAPVLDADVSGAGEGRLRLSGPVEAPDLDVELVVSDAVVADTALGRVEASGQLRDAAAAPRGTLRLQTGDGPLGALEASSEFLLAEAALELSELRAATADGLVLEQGRLKLSMDGGALEGSAELAAADLAPVARRFDLPALGGQGRFTLTLRPGEAGQAATLEGRLGELVMDDGALRAAALDVAADLDDVFEAPRGRLRLALLNAEAGDARFDSAALTATGTMEDAALSLEAEGDAYGPLEVAADAVLTREGAATALRLERFDAAVQGQRFALAHPAVFRHGPDGLALEDFALTADEGQLRADIVQEGGMIDATVDLDGLPLALTRLVLAEPTLSGRLEGQLRLTGPAAAPEGTLQLTAQDVALEEADLPAMDVWVSGQLEDGSLGLTGQLRGLSPTPVQLVLRVPATLSVEPPALELARTEPIAGELSWEGNVAHLMPLLPTSGHELRGRSEIALRLAGTLEDPELEGHAALQEATYENLVVGTFLTDLNARLEGDGAGLELTQLEASDGGSGRVHGEGRISFEPGVETPVQIAMRAEGARLVRRDELTARSDAEITLSGTPADLLLEGLITVDRAEARIPERLPPQVASLDVVEVGGDRQVEAELEQVEVEGEGENGELPDSPAMGQLRLDVAVDIPSRFFLRGGGLDSEWAGNLLITGTSDEPVLSGRIHIVRGRLDFFGRSFDIDEGSVSFDGGPEIDPVIEAEATARTRDIEATVRISGPISAPEFGFSSVPELPQDEILSRLLFGKSVTNLSALEAAQLAAAVAQVSMGGMGGDGIMGRLRGMLGVDVLRFGGEDGETTITAGRYIGNDLFIGVERGIEAETGAVRMEYDLTDNITVESGVGATGRSEVSIQFKWDY